MRGKRELPRKRPPILLFVLIFAAGFLAGTLFWHFRSSGASVPSGGTVTLPEGPAGTDVSSEPEIPPAPPQDGEPSAEPTPFVISFLGDCTLTSSHHTNHFEKLQLPGLIRTFSAYCAATSATLGLKCTSATKGVS